MTETTHGEINFSSFLISLATQAMMQLGEAPSPDGMSVPVDVAMAKQTIDIISLLREKTRNNLDQFEEQLFEEILHNLRMTYIRHTTKS